MSALDMLSASTMVRSTVLEPTVFTPSVTAVTVKDCAVFQLPDVNVSGPSTESPGWDVLSNADTTTSALGCDASTTDTVADSPSRMMFTGSTTSTAARSSSYTVMVELEDGTQVGVPASYCASVEEALQAMPTVNVPSADVVSSAELSGTLMPTFCAVFQLLVVKVKDVVVSDARPASAPVKLALRVTSAVGASRSCTVSAVPLKPSCTYAVSLDNTMAALRHAGLGVSTKVASAMRQLQVVRSAGESADVGQAKQSARLSPEPVLNLEVPQHSNAHVCACACGCS